MTELLAALVAFPTIIFTGMLGLSMFYWLLVIVGAIELEMIDFRDIRCSGPVHGRAEFTATTAACSPRSRTMGQAPSTERSGRAVHSRSPKWRS